MNERQSLFFDNHFHCLFEMKICSWYLKVILSVESVLLLFKQFNVKGPLYELTLTGSSYRSATVITCSHEDRDRVG